MAEIDVLKAQIVRQDLNTPWGFVLQGGVDQGSPVKIQSLLPGSPAARIGLKSGDEVTEIGDIQTEGLTYQQVQELIGKHGDTLILTVERRARGSVPTNPVMNATETEPLKDYQPYDMTGAQQHPAPVSNPQPAATAGSDAKQAAGNPEAEPKPAAEATPTASSASPGESAQPAQTAPAEKNASETQSKSTGAEASSVESKPAEGQAPAAETKPAVEQKQDASEPSVKNEVPSTSAGTVSAAAPALAPISVAPVVVQETTSFHYAQTVEAHPPETGGKPTQRRRVRPRPNDPTNIQPPTGPISQIVQGVQPVTFTPSHFQPAPPAPGAYYPGREPVANTAPVLPTEVRRRPPQPEPIKGYQPYDMSGPRHYQPVQAQPQIYQFETVRARPFEEKPRPYYRPQAQSPPPPLVSPPQPAPLQQQQYMTSSQPQQYSPRSYDYQDYQPSPRSEEPQLTQSRTFKVLESLMSSEEPAAGVQGLPRQRTLSQEIWKAEQEAKRGSPRVKVFMPQQYNSPLGIYSAKNVVETFQAQAETVMDAMERHSSENYPMSEVQRAVMDN